MTADEFATAILTIKGDLVTKLRAELPNTTEVLDRFIFSGITSEDEWVAALRTGDVIRKCIVLMPQLDLGLLSQTGAGGSFAPDIVFGIELYHDYKFGTDTDNTEEEFLKDAAKIIYTLGKNRALPHQSFITRASLRIGMRPSRVQSLHKAAGQVTVDLRNLKYT